LAVVTLATACGSKAARLEIRSFDSQALGRGMSYSVLQPPACPAAERRGLHVIYLLHGYGGDYRSLDEEGLSDRFFVAQAEGRIPHVFMVMPDGEQGFYLNWHDGTRRYEDYLVEEVVPQAERDLGLEVPRERRHIVGVSMGGYGALLVGLRHPELFESVASISGVIFNEDKAIDLAHNRFLSWTIDIDRMLGDGGDREFLEDHNPYSLLDRLPAERRPRLFLAAGTEEPKPIRRPSVLFHEHLVAEGVEHEWYVFEGSHNWQDWVPAIERAITHATR